MMDALPSSASALAATLVAVALAATAWLLTARRATPLRSTPPDGPGLGQDAWWAQALADERALVRRSEWVSVGERRLAADVVRLSPEGADTGQRCLLFFPGNPGLVCGAPRLAPARSRWPPTRADGSLALLPACVPCDRSTSTFRC